MSGAWGKPLVQREQTEEERAAAVERARQKKIDDAARALIVRATRLKNAVVAAIKTRGGGVSSKYGSDEQYTVGGTWSKAEVGQAFELWKAEFSTAAITSLGIHKLGPNPKESGGRDGKFQFNFIRNISATNKGRFNIHVDWNDA